MTTNVTPAAGTVLIISDDDHDREQIALDVWSLGYSIATARNGVDGLAMLQVGVVDLRAVIVDLGRSGRGAAFARQIAHFFPRVPQLIIGDEALPVSVIGAAPRRFLRRPIAPAELARHLRELCE